MLTHKIYTDDMLSFTIESLKTLKIDEKYTIKTPIDEKKLLVNVYNDNNLFLPTIFITKIKEEYYILKGQEVIEIMDKFFKDEIEVDFLEPATKISRTFSNLKSFDKKKFQEHSFNVIYVSLLNFDEITEFLDSFV